MSRLRGIVWFIRRYGLRTWWGYNQARRAGMQVDYGRILTADELARLGEHFVPAPWESRS